MPRLHLPPLAHPTCFKERFLSAIELVLPDMSSQSGLVTAAERASRKRLPGTRQCSLGRGRSPFFLHSDLPILPLLLQILYNAILLGF